MIIEGKLELIGRHCASSGLYFEEYNKPGKYLFQDKSLDTESNFVKYGRAHSFLSRVEDVCVFGDGFIVDANGNVFVHGLNHRNYHLDIDDYLISANGDQVTLDLPDISGECAESAVLIWGASNFSHWLFEYLPRLAVVARNSSLKDIAYVITDDMPDRYVDFLLRVGIKKDQLIVLKQGGSYFFKDLWVPSVVAYRGHYSDTFPYLWPDAIRYLREKIVGDHATMSRPARSHAKRIYISRRGAQWRRPVNEEQVSECLEQFGVVEIEMGSLSHEEQLEYISNAELIVIAVGGGSSITMYAPLECVIIELSPTHLVGTWASMAWAHVLGQYFQRLVCQSEEQTRDSNYIVDIDILSEYLVKSESILRPKISFYQELANFSHR